MTTDTHAKPRPLEPLAAIAAGENNAVVTTELAARRTGLSFQRTRLSADRTLMSVMRTSLSLISFGFTIFQFFQKLKGSQILAGESHAPRTFGATLVWLGVGLLIVGIVYHAQFMWGLRATRNDLRAEGILHGQSRFPVSFTLLVAIALLLVGFAAIASITFHIGPLE